MRKNKNILRIITMAFIVISAIYGRIQYDYGIELVRLKFGGGGDWYNGPSELPNLADFANKNANLPIYSNDNFVEIMSEDLFNFPFLFMTGHGNVSFSDEEALRLRNYLENGGFLFVNDDYSLDKPFRRELIKVFPDAELIELPFTHEIYHSFYNFSNGLPKIHEHDKNVPQGFGIFHDGKLVLFYAYESDIADGWDDPQVHSVPEDKRIEALKMGTNILIYLLNN